MHAYIYIFIFMYPYTYTYTHIYTYAYTNTYTYKYTYTYAYTNTYLKSCAPINTYSFTRTYARMCSHQGKTILFYVPEMEPLAREVVDHSKGKIVLGGLQWKRFADSFPNLRIGRRKHAYQACCRVRTACGVCMFILVGVTSFLTTWRRYFETQYV